MARHHFFHFHQPAGFGVGGRVSVSSDDVGGAPTPLEGAPSAVSDTLEVVRA